MNGPHEDNFPLICPVAAPAAAICPKVPAGKVTPGATVSSTSISLAISSPNSVSSSAPPEIASNLETLRSVLVVLPALLPGSPRLPPLLPLLLLPDRPRLGGRLPRALPADDIKYETQAFNYVGKEMGQRRPPLFPPLLPLFVKGRERENRRSCPFLPFLPRFVKWGKQRNPNDEGKP